jgi:hypothetical protein
MDNKVQLVRNRGYDYNVRDQFGKLIAWFPSEQSACEHAGELALASGFPYSVHKRVATVALTFDETVRRAQIAAAKKKQ